MVWSLSANRQASKRCVKRLVDRDNLLPKTRFRLDGFRAFRNGPRANWGVACNTKLELRPFSFGLSLKLGVTRLHPVWRTRGRQWDF